MLSLRTALESQLIQLGVEPGDFQGVSLLLRENFLVGQRLTWAGAQAVWFAEPNEAKLFDDRGHVIARLSPVPIATATDGSDQQEPNMIPFPAPVETETNEQGSERRAA